MTESTHTTLRHWHHLADCWKANKQERDQVLGYHCQPTSFPLESGEKRSEFAAALLSGDLRVSYQLTPLLPPLPGSLHLSSFYSFGSSWLLPSFFAFSESPAFFRLFAFAQNELWHQSFPLPKPSAHIQIFIISKVRVIQSTLQNVFSDCSSLIWFLPPLRFIMEPYLYTYSSFYFLPGVVGVQGLALFSLIAANSLKDDSLLYS